LSSAPESGKTANGKVIKRYEKTLVFSDKESENYVAGLAILGVMYLQNMCNED